MRWAAPLALALAVLLGFAGAPAALGQSEGAGQSRGAGQSEGSQDETVDPGAAASESSAAGGEAGSEDVSGEAGDAGAGEETASGASAAESAPSGVPVIDFGAVVQGPFDPDYEPEALGSLDYTAPGEYDPTTDYLLYVRPSWWGMGVESATLTRHFDSVAAQVAAEREPAKASEQYVVQNSVDGPGYRYRAFAAIALELSLDGSPMDGVELFGSSARGRVWERDADPHAHRYFAEIATEGGTGEVVARLVREFELAPGTYELVVRQRLVNLTDRPMQARWWQDGPLNLQLDTSGYRIELRRLRMGWTDPALLARQNVEVVRADEKLRAMRWGVDRVTSRRFVPGDDQVWPNREVWETRAEELSWVAQTDRFFAAAAHALVQESVSPMAGGSAVVGPEPASKELHLAERVLIDAPRAPEQGLPWTLDEGDLSRLSVRMISGGYAVPAGAELNLDFGVYLGPLSDQTLVQDVDPQVEAVGLHEVVVYSLGGFLACCTFPWLGEILLIVLRFFESFTLDWAVSIVLLVVVVRTVLHPITKKSQVSLLRFSKQMQRIAPKQKKLQEKYKDDPKKMREEVTKLMREEHINPAGALGCLPMFLQTPIWIALYAMLYMNFDLRHEGGFYGVFQGATGGSWEFLADLSRGDHFIPLPDAMHFSVPLMGTIAAINVIPLLMGVLFYIQQKYMTPAPSTELSPEMASQQKIMKVMLVVMFPIFMYNAPAALTLYFMTNSTLGIFESRYIRNHVDQVELEMEAHGVKSVRQLKKKKAASRMAARPTKGLGERERFKKRK